MLPVTRSDATHGEGSSWKTKVGGFIEKAPRQRVPRMGDAARFSRPFPMASSFALESVG